MVCAVWCSNHGHDPVTDGINHTGNYNSFFFIWHVTACILNYVAFLCGLTAREFQFYVCYCCSIHVLLLFYTRVTVVLYTCYCCFIHVLLLFYTRVTAVLYACYCCFIHVLLLFYTRVTAVLYACYCCFIHVLLPPDELWLFHEYSSCSEQYEQRRLSKKYIMEAHSILSIYSLRGIGLF